MKPYSPTPSSSVSIAPEDLSCACATAIWRRVAMAALSFEGMESPDCCGRTIVRRTAPMPMVRMSSVRANPGCLLLAMLRSLSARRDVPDAPLSADSRIRLSPQCPKACRDQAEGITGSVRLAGLAAELVRDEVGREALGSGRPS